MKKLLIAAAIAGVAAVVKGKAKFDRDEWRDLTESQARERLEDRIPSKIPPERREEIKDKVVSTMLSRGVIKPDLDAKGAGPTVDLTSVSTPPPVETDA